MAEVTVVEGGIRELHVRSVLYLIGLTTDISLSGILLNPSGRSSCELNQTCP
jgi:hypothetical protein